jgi:hypothetical protein
MVLICNNNVLTIDAFHKHRCEEKSAIRDIIVNRKYLREKYKEEPEKEYVVPTTQSREVFMASAESLEIKTTRSITFNRR